MQWASFLKNILNTLILSSIHIHEGSTLPLTAGSNVPNVCHHHPMQYRNHPAKLPTSGLLPADNDGGVGIFFGNHTSPAVFPTQPYPKRMNDANVEIS